MSHSLVSNIILLLCITVAAKIASISKVPKSLKGCISNTLYGRHTKFGSDLPERVLNTSKGLLWCCIILFGNHGNQLDLRWPLPPKSPIHNYMLNNQNYSYSVLNGRKQKILCLLSYVNGTQTSYTVQCVNCSYCLLDKTMSNQIFGWLMTTTKLSWYTYNRLMEKLRELREKTDVPITRHNFWQLSNNSFCH